MPTILTKKSDTPGAVPATANLTNAAGGAELAVNTADKRLFTINSNSAVVELGTNPSSLTCADVSATVLRAGSATITNLTVTSATIDNFTFTSATVTRLAATSAVITDLSATVGRISSGTITQLTSTSATVSTLTSTSATVSNLNSTSANITTLTGTTFGTTATTQLRGASGQITQLNSTSATITTLTATSASVTNLTATSIVISNLSIASANITTLTSSSATITNLVNTSASITTLTNNPTFSAGTANGVLYLNGSKVATSGSALVFDGTNLGLGVTPSAWASQRRAIALGAAGNAIAGSTANGALELYCNATINTSGNYAYNSTGTASLYSMSGNIHSWNIAASGTAGNAITFTQAMTLNASGNLGVGTTSVSGRLHIATGGETTSRFDGSRGAADNLPVVTIPFWNVSNGVGDKQIATIGVLTGTSSNQTQKGQIYFSTSDGTLTERARIDSSGNLLIGGSSQLGSSRLFIEGQNATDIYPICANTSSAANTSTGISIGGYGNAAPGAGGSVAIKCLHNHGGTTQSQMAFFTHNGTAFGERARITAAGDMGIGTTSPGAKLSVDGSAIFNDSGADVDFRIEGDTDANLFFVDASTDRIGIGTNTPDALLNVDGVASFGAGSAAAPSIAAAGDLNTGIFFPAADTLGFSTNGTERARITAGGFFKASDAGTYLGSTGAYHELRSSTTNQFALRVSNTATSSPSGIEVFYTGAAPNGTTNYFLDCYDNNAGATQRAGIRSNGGIANYQANDVNLSDQRVKKDIKPLGSMWDKFKALEIVTFKYKDQTHDDDNIGVIAQQVESVAPEFIDTDGFGNTPEGEEPLKTVYTTDMYHAAIKALQEAMARIEQLEAKVAALEA